MKKFHAILLLLGLVFLSCLIWRIGVRELWHELIMLGWGLVLVILLEFVAEGIHSIGWRCCLSEKHGRLPWHRLFRIRMAGYAINYLTPTAALGGEATKAALLFSDHRGPEAFSGVLAGKLCAGVGQLLFVILGSGFAFCSVALPTSVWAAMILSAGLVSSGMLIFLLLQKYGKLGTLIRWLASRRFAGRMLLEAASRINDVDEKLKAIYRDRPRVLVLAVGWHLLAHSVGILQTLWFLYFMHEPAPLTTVVGVWVLGLWFDLLTFAVPLNLGTLEGSRMVAFRAAGLGAVSGMTFGIAQRLAQLACTAFGLITYAGLVRHLAGSAVLRERYTSDETAVCLTPVGVIGRENES